MEELEILEKTIMLIEEDIKQLNFKIKYQNERLENLKHQKKSLLNYLNEND